MEKEKIICSGCGKEVDECGYCEKDNRPFGDCCWTQHVDSCPECAELNL